MRIVPMPIPMSHGGGISPEDMLALLIMINFLCVITWLIIIYVFIIIKPKDTFEKVTFYGYMTYQSIAGLATTTTFCVINLIGILIWGASIIKEML